MRARIYQPARSAMQSGMGKTRIWVLEFAPASSRSIDPLMGWTATDDTQTQVRLNFDSKNAALAYAAQKGIEAEVIESTPRKPVLRPGGYGENFATSRRGAWTH
jgi:NADH dehydrogenase